MYSTFIDNNNSIDNGNKSDNSISRGKVNGKDQGFKHPNTSTNGIITEEENDYKDFYSNQDPESNDMNKRASVRVATSGGIEYGGSPHTVTLSPRSASHKSDVNYAFSRSRNTPTVTTTTSASTAAASASEGAEGGGGGRTGGGKGNDLERLLAVDFDSDDDDV